MTMGMLGRSLWQGMVAGAVGTAAMTLSEKLEQRFTGRPDSYVPGRTLQRLLGRRESRRHPSRAMNLGMHYGQGTLLGVVRSMMANAGLRGPRASAMFTVMRVTKDQVLENATGVGAPLWMWPRDQLAIDLLHKSVYGYTTGAVADRLARRERRAEERRAAEFAGRPRAVEPVPVGGPADERPREWRDVIGEPRH
jgi:hypothetical protein